MLPLSHYPSVDQLKDESNYDAFNSSYNIFFTFNRLAYEIDPQEKSLVRPISEGGYENFKVTRLSDTSMTLTLADGSKESITLQAQPNNIPGVTVNCLFKGEVYGHSDSSVIVSGCKDDDISIISISASFLTNGIVDLSLTKAGETSLLPNVPLSHSDNWAARRWRCSRSFTSSDLQYFCPACPRRGMICNGGKSKKTVLSSEMITD